MAFISAFQAEDGGSIPPTRSFMKFTFLVQGEGRGHMTQALNLKESLEKKGHSVSRVFIGAKNLDSLPSFFIEKINCPIEVINSPRFLTDKKGQGILFFKSIVFSFLSFPLYINSLKKIKKLLRADNPDAVISFYEPLTALYFRFYKDKRPVFFIAHQYFMSHPAFSDFFRNKKEELLFKVYNSFNSIKRGVKICLSFTKEIDIEKENLYVCPPLIKSEIKNKHLKTRDNNFILAYLLNSGYSQEIIKWSKNNNVKIEAFRNSPETKKEKINDFLTFHHLNNALFNEKLSECSAYVSTAGFESVAEAAYLEKKTMMIPTKNHFEQSHNAIDAMRAKIAISAKHFNISLILEAQDEFFSGIEKYQKWCQEENKIIEIIEKKCL